MRLLRDLGAELTRLHEGGAVHGGISPASVERTEGGAFRLRPAEAAGRDPWLSEPPEVVDGDAPTVQSDAYELAATTEVVVRETSWEVPGSLVVAVQRGLRENPAARPSVTAFVVCATEGLVDLEAEDGHLAQTVDATDVTGPPTDAVPVLADQGEPAAPGGDGPLDGEEQDSERIARLREALRAAADEPPRRGLPGAARPRPRVLVAAAVGLLLAGGLWWVGREGPEPVAAQTAAQPAPEVPGEDRAPADGDPAPEAPPASPASPVESSAAQQSSTARAPSVEADHLEELLQARASAWAAGDEEALAEVVVPGSPAWQRDTATDPGEGLPDRPGYRVLDLQAVPGEEGPEQVVTASVAQGPQGRPVPVRLVLEQREGTGQPLRLVDWSVVP